MNKVKDNNLRIYNSLSRTKEKFEPLMPGFVGIYVCGPTVYGDSHLGHAKSYISFDIIVRYLRYLGYKVRYVQNITDVGHLLGDANEGEDRVLKAARLEHLEPMEVVERYTRSYFEDMDRLNVLRPDISPRASGHISEQVEMIQELIKKGHAYEINGNVYFSVSSFKDYGKLSGRTLDELKSGTRVESASDKKHPSDFALWKVADPSHIMKWNSPWGVGYPGWHIECSCMSTKYLGETFDIHGGGLENMFPHHECEIAQSEAALEKPFARYWLHNNMVTVDGVKMGKSLGNFITLKEAFKSHDPLAIRFFILGSHYRSTLDFSKQALDAAEKGFQRLVEAVARINSIEVNGNDSGESQLQTTSFLSAFDEAMQDDFNSPRAIATVFDFLKWVNVRIDEGNTFSQKDIDVLKGALRSTLDDVLGIWPKQELEQTRNNLDEVMQILIELRASLRKEKNFKLADQIRGRLDKIGITLKDTPNGTTWR